MTKIKIEDLPKDTKVGQEELRWIGGGSLGSLSQFIDLSAKSRWGVSSLESEQKLDRMLALAQAAVDYPIMLAMQLQQKTNTEDT